MTDFTLENVEFLRKLKSRTIERQSQLDIWVDIPQEEEVEEEKKYTQDWPAYNTAAMNEKRLSFQILEELLSYIKIKEPQIVGRKKLPFKEQVIALFIQTYNNLSSRRSFSDFMAARDLGHLSKPVHFNSLLRYAKNPDLSIMLRKLISLSSLPLKGIDSVMAVDGSGIATRMYERWMDVRTSRPSLRRLFKKIHIVSGTKTNIIVSARVSEGHCHDGNYFRELIVEADKYHNFDVITADKAYLSKKNMQVSDDLGILPFIPFKKNNRGNPRGTQMWRIMFNAFQNDREKFMSIYHKRSNVECTFHMIKKKFGFSIRAEDPVAQENQILMKCLCHNLAVLVHSMFKFEIPIEFKGEEG